MIALPSGITRDAIVVGRAGMDLYPDPPGTRIDEASRFVADLGGSAGNIAVAMARHGARVALAAPVSDDPVGQYVAAQLAALGVEHLTPAPVSGDARTSLALAETVADGSRAVIYRNGAADFALSPDALTSDIVRTARAVVVTGTALAAEPSRSTALGALRAAHTAVLDLDYRPYSWPDPETTRAVCAEAIETVDILVGNAEEFGQIAPPGIDGATHARRLSDDATLIYKMGGEGCRVIRDGEAGPLIPPFRVGALKPFGAGDAFLGGALARLLQGEMLENALRFAAAAAALVVGRVGCAGAMPTTPEVLNFIACQEAPHA